MYQRVMLKLSGQALAGGTSDVFHGPSIEYIAGEIIALANNGIQVAAMVGGGNVFRGKVSEKWNIERAEADNIGMLGTIANGLMLRGAIESLSDLQPRVMSALAIPSVAEPYIRRRALHHLEKGQIIILVGGIGEPLVTTDYPSVQRAIELKCDAVLAAKNGVDGVYSSDPKVDADAALYEAISYTEAIAKNLSFMDAGALVLTRAHSLPTHVFNFDAKGCAQRICNGEVVGTYLNSGIDTRQQS